MIGIRECKIHGLVKFYLKSDGRLGECTICKKIRTSRSNNPPVVSILKGDQVWINNVIKGPLRREKNDIIRLGNS